MTASPRASVGPVRKWLWLALASLVLLLASVLLLVVLVVLQLRGEALPAISGAAAPASPGLIERGAYLARAGNCAACHTARGGPAYAGGRAIETPFGQVFSSNLTPDAATGLGAWSKDAFWRALHHGQSRDGRLLNPAFPYGSYTRITREDSDALWAFLQSQPAVLQVNRPHALRFPYNTPVALAVWRELYFEPQAFQSDTARSAEWNRGAYLVQGLGHCGACHSARDALGGLQAGGAFAGAVMPKPAWYAPSLRASGEAGVAQWEAQHIVALLKSGVAPQASVLGPMADVVFESTQHLTDADLHAMATYLQELEPLELEQHTPEPAGPEQMALGEQVYKQHCVDCHGPQGQGAAGAYPPLAGNRAVTLAAHANTVLAVLGGGFAPATHGNPQPFGMPPFRTLLTDAEIAAVTSFMRQSWGNQASAVSPLQVQRLR